MDSKLKNHFSTLKKIINEALGDEEKDKFTKELDRLSKKCQSKDIYVAVVGEFNSGKSTFINALLRKRILKEAGRPTTAVATHITRSKPHHLLQYIFGTQSYVSVRFDDNQSFMFHERNYSQCSTYLQETYRSIQPHSLYDIIQIITTEQEIAKHVVHLHLELKARSLPKNMVIIDTPGFNPGETSFENHLQITKDIVTQVADIAFILTPSTQAISATLFNFLKINIHRYIHRCVFLVTKIDLIPKDEREYVYEYVRNQIRKLGVQFPQVYGISARTMLPVKKIPDSMKDTWPLYQKDFCQIEQECWDNLAKYKEITLREHVYHLLKKLSKEIKDTIDTHTQELQYTLQILKDNQIKRIEELTDDLYKETCYMLDCFYNKIDFSVDSFKKTAKVACSSIIRESGKLKNYKKKEAPKINLAISKQGNLYTLSIKNSIELSTEIIAKGINKFSSKFHSHYKDLASLEPKMNYPPNIRETNSTSIDLSFSNSLRNKTWLGRWIINIRNYFRTEEIIQEKVISEINNKIDNYFIQLESNMKTAIDLAKEKQKKCLKDYYDKHIQQYGKLIETLIQEQTQEKIQLENNISINYGYIYQISELQKEIQTEISLFLAQIKTNNAIIKTDI